MTLSGSMTRLALRAGSHLAALTLAVLSASTQAATPFEVRVTGEGPDVLLLPGLASSGDVWEKTVKRFCVQHRCHVFTLAGFAGVAAEPGPLLDHVDAALASYIEQRKLSSPTVVGHSLGGFIALRLAIDHPQDVGRLVIVDSLPALGAIRQDDLTPAQLRESAAQMRTEMLAQEPAAQAASRTRAIASMVTAPGDVERVTAWGNQSDRLTVIDAMADMIGNDLRPRLSGIRVPTLVMGSWIAYQNITTMENVRAAYERQYKSLDGVQIVMSPVGRHFIMLDDPEWFETTLEGFVR